MLHRVAATAALVGGLLLAGCKSESAAGKDEKADTVPSTERVTAKVDAGSTAVSEAHGDKWADPEDPKSGGFSAFKEAWVYVDGQPVGVLREIELPPMPEVWIEQVELLDFKRGDPGPHERTYEVRRWRLADYLKAVGFPPEKIKGVYLHGGRGVVALTGDQFRKLAKGLLFDLTGNTGTKLRLFLPDEATKFIKTSFDRYAAISVVVDKPVLDTNDHNTLIDADGNEVYGIPYYGQPLRGGVRVYLDGRLAFVIKRNALGDEGRVAPGKNEWNLGTLLAARGIDLGELGAVDVVDVQENAKRLEGVDLSTLTFSTETQAQGAVMLSTGTPTNTLQLWSKGKVPKTVRTKTPGERYPDETKKKTK